MKTAITAILLAGGESTRFWPFAEKNTLVVCGKELLFLHYQQLVKAGVKECIVVTNERTNEHIRAVLVPEGLVVKYVIQKGQGMGRAVASLEGIVNDEPILILNASDYYSDKFIASFLKNAHKKKDMIVGAVKVKDYFPGGYLRFNSDQTVAEIIEKPVKGSEPSDIVNISVDYFPQAKVIIEAAKKFGDDPFNGYENALSKIISSGLPCRVEISDFTDWQPIKYPWHVLDVMDQLLSQIEGQHIDTSVVIKPNVIIEGPVVIEAGVKIFEGTKIVGPVYIGKNTIIGNNNIIRSSVIGENCVTGFNTDITRSRIGDGCWFHTNYIGDSVIGKNVSMGSGTVTANLRLDDGTVSSVVKEEKIDTGRNKLGAMIGENVRIGVNASTMPGIKIGGNSFIAAGLVVSCDIPEGSFVRPTGVGFVIKPNTKAASTSREGFRKTL